MKRITKWLISIGVAYKDLLILESDWKKYYAPYSKCILFARRLSSIIVYTVVVWFLVTLAIKLNWVVVVVPMG